jgi:ABC-type transport system substrate-binding protein
MVISGWMEQLTADNWTLSPTIYDYSGSFRPSDYVKGFLAESWEFTDANTYVIHLRKGIHWQDIPPVNGREFTADDAVYHYHRLYGGGDGFTKPSPY